MKTSSLITLLAVAAAVVAVVALRPARTPAPPADAGGPASAAVVSATAAAVRLPRLLELGSSSCVPCKAMVPVLAELAATYAGVLQVESIDVREDRAAGQAHGVQAIPTQILFAPDGRELCRHEGFWAKEDILAAWQRCGHPLVPGGR